MLPWSSYQAMGRAFVFLGVLLMMFTLWVCLTTADGALVVLGITMTVVCAFGTVAAQILILQSDIKSLESQISGLAAEVYRR